MNIGLTQIVLNWIKPINTTNRNTRKGTNWVVLIEKERVNEMTNWEMKIMKKKWQDNEIEGTDWVVSSSGKWLRLFYGLT